MMTNNSKRFPTEYTDEELSKKVFELSKDIDMPDRHFIVVAKNTSLIGIGLQELQKRSNSKSNQISNVSLLISLVAVLLSIFSFYLSFKSTNEEIRLWTETNTTISKILLKLK